MSALKRLLAVDYCWMTFNVQRPDLALKMAFGGGSDNDATTTVIDNKTVNRLKEQENEFAYKVKNK